MAFEIVARTSELKDGAGLRVTVGGKAIALFRVAGEILAIDDECTHLGASLAEGALEGDRVVCPWHRALFELRTGKSAGPPARGDVTAYRCRTVGDAIGIEWDP
jgi:nitrite reductase/ring-hydroxylating ferredoxin subunit